jgi:hypothetical protein
MRYVKAKIQVDPWTGAVGAKAELQQAWFRVRGYPMIREVRKHLLM